MRAPISRHGSEIRCAAAVTDDSMMVRFWILTLAGILISAYPINTGQNLNNPMTDLLRPFKEVGVSSACLLKEKFCALPQCCSPHVPFPPKP